MLHHLLLLPLLAPTTQAQDTATGLDPTQDALRYEIPTADAPREVRVDRRTYATWLVRDRGRARAPVFAKAVAVARLAGERGIEVDDAELRASVLAELDQRVEMAFDGDRAAWLREVEVLGRTVEGIVAERVTMQRTDELARRILAQEWTVGPAEIAAEWERRHGPEGHRIEVRGLGLDLAPPPSERPTSDEEERARRDAYREARLEQARAIRARVADGADFGALVDELLEDEGAAASGGDMGGTVRRSQWPGEVIDALIAADVGFVTEPFEARSAIWMLQVRSTEHTPLEEVRDTIETELLERGPGTAEVAAFLDAVRSATTVDFPLAEVEADPAAALASGTLTVDGRDVPIAEYARWLMRAEGETYMPEYVGRRRVEALADAADLEIAPVALDARVDRELRWTLELGFSGRKEQWLARLASIGSTEAEWRIDIGRKLRVQMLAEALMMSEREIGPEQARSLYLERYGTSGERVDARYIVFDLGIEPRGENESPRVWKERLAEAAQPLMPTFQELQERHDEGEDFASLVERYSQDPVTRRNGGRPPGGFDESQLPEDVRLALRSLPLGVLSEPQVIGSSAYFFEVIERVKVEFADVLDELVEELERRPPSPARVAAFINDLTQRADPRPLPGLWR